MGSRKTTFALHSVNMEGGVVTTNRTAPAGRPQNFRDAFCNLQPGQLRIPRPTFTGMEFVQTRGRQGYYMSTRRRDPWGTNPQPRRPLLSEVNFQQAIPEDSASSNSDESSLASSDKSSSKDSISGSDSLSSDSDKRSEGSDGSNSRPNSFPDRNSGPQGL